MQSTGQAGTQSSQPVHSGAMTVCISLLPPTMASTGQAWRMIQPGGTDAPQGKRLVASEWRSSAFPSGASRAFRPPASALCLCVLAVLDQARHRDRVLALSIGLQRAGGVEREQRVAGGRRQPERSRSSAGEGGASPVAGDVAFTLWFPVPPGWIILSDDFCGIGCRSSEATSARLGRAETVRHQRRTLGPTGRC